MRSPDGERWNFSSLGSASSAKKTEPAAGGATSISPSLSVAKLAVSERAADHQPRSFSREAASLRQSGHYRDQFLFRHLFSVDDDGESACRGHA